MAATPDHDRHADAGALRAEARERWERAASGWGARHARQQAMAMPISHWLIDAIEPQPGQRVLELAAGVGETGFLAAELIAPGGGTLVCSDGAEAMLTRARERAAELGLRNVEFEQLELEWIDLPAASVDAVLCRWGYMFALDRASALRETRRVLRAGGRVALATWAAPERNPWAGVRNAALEAGGHAPPVNPGAPGPFDLSTRELLAELLADAGFTEVVTAELGVSFPFASVEDYWDDGLAMSPFFSDAVGRLDASAVAALRARIAGDLEPYHRADGGFDVPGVALVAAASA